MTSSAVRRAGHVLAATAAVGALGLTSTSAAQAAPATARTTTVSSTVVGSAALGATATTGLAADEPGDGTWDPSHDPSLAVIPICKGPAAVGEWLKLNFADHGNDIDAYIARNTTILQQLATAQMNPFLGPILLAGAIVQIPVYAISDALFHLPATALSLATGCGFIKLTGINPF